MFNNFQQVQIALTTAPVKEDLEMETAFIEAVPLEKPEFSRYPRETLSASSSQVANSRESKKQGPVSRLQPQKSWQVVAGILVNIASSKTLTS